MVDSQIKVFPWTNREEFKRVFHELYSNRKALQTHALARIEVWKSRVTKLPVAVDATSQLIRYSTISDISDTDQTQALGFMIMKFVNNITEEKQQKFHKQPLTYIASEMGIDKWIVNVRHQIAHGDMPSMRVLQAATHWSLNWLKINFWEKQIKESEKPNVLCIGERLAVLKNLLDQYMTQRLQKLCKKKVYVTDGHLLHQIEQSMFGLGNKSWTALVQVGYLISTENQLSKMALSSKAVYRDAAGLPDIVYSLWQPVISVLDRIGLLASLLLHIVTMVTKEPSFKNRLLYGWVYMILVKREEWVSDIPYRQLLEITIQVINQFGLPSLYILIELVKKHHLSDVKKEALKCELERLYNQLNSDTAHVQPQSHCEEEMDDERPTIEKQKWSKCVEKVNWSNYPLGLLPDQSLSYNNLELDWSGIEEEGYDLEDLEPMVDSNLEMMQTNGIDSDNWSLNLDETQWTEDKMKAIVDQIILF